MRLIPLFTTWKTELAPAYAFYVIASDRFLYVRPAPWANCCIFQNPFIIVRLFVYYLFPFPCTFTCQWIMALFTTVETVNIPALAFDLFNCHSYRFPTKNLTLLIWTKTDIGVGETVVNTDFLLVNLHHFWKVIFDKCLQNRTIHTVIHTWEKDESFWKLLFYIFSPTL